MSATARHNDPTIARARRSRIATTLIRLSVGLACAILWVLVEVGLDEVVAPAPWLIVSFAAGFIAALLGGLPGGVVAAGLGWIGQLVVIPALLEGRAVPVEVGWPTDAGVAVAGLVVGLWVRSMILRRPALQGVPAAKPGQPGQTGDGATAPTGTPVRRRSELEILTAAVADFAAARTPVQVADALARNAVALSGAAGAVVYLPRAGTDGLVAQARHGPPEIDGPERVAVPTVARPAQLRIGRTIEVPLGRSAPLGVLRLAAGNAQAAVRGDGLVELLAGLAGDAIERSRLEGARRNLADRASAADRRVAILAELAAELVGATTVADVARTLVDLAVDQLGAGFATVHVPDPATGALELIEARGYPAGLVARERSIAPDTALPATRAATTQAVVEISGEDGWKAEFPEASNAPAITGVRAISAIPMQAAGTVQGVLVIGWRTDAGRATTDSGLLSAAADQGAQALERAILHAQDEDARRLQEAFIGVVSHELRTPITTILAGSRLLRRRLDGDAAAADLSDDISAEADRLSRIVDDLLVLSRLERRHLTVGDEPVHLDHMVRRVVASEAARWPEHAFVTPEGSGGRVVRGDETYVEQVLRNLVANAAKYSPAGSRVEVAIEEVPGGETVVRVLDEGPGVEPSEVDELFGLFYRSPRTSATAAGAGIGLFVSRRLVAEMGGRIWAAARPGGGSEFGFALSAYPFDEEIADADVADRAGASGEAAGMPGGSGAGGAPSAVGAVDGGPARSGGQ